jgi:hypothetical protein
LKLVSLAQKRGLFGSFLETECSSLLRRSPEVWGRSLSPNVFQMDHVVRILNILVSTQVARTLDAEAGARSVLDLHHANIGEAGAAVLQSALVEAAGAALRRLRSLDLCANAPGRVENNAELGPSDDIFGTPYISLHSRSFRLVP